MINSKLNEASLLMFFFFCVETLSPLCFIVLPVTFVTLSYLISSSYILRPLRGSGLEEMNKELMLYLLSNGFSLK